MDELRRYVQHTLFCLIVLTASGVIFLLVMSLFGLISGWLIGCGLNVLYFIMLSNRSAKSMSMNPQSAYVSIRGGAFFRIMMIVLMVIVVLQFPSVNIWAVVAGIMSYRMIIFFEAIKNALGEKNLEGRR